MVSTQEAFVKRIWPFGQCLYDVEEDILYLSVGSPRPSWTFEVEPGVLVRRDPTTREVTGLTLMDLKRFAKEDLLPRLQSLGLPDVLIQHLRTCPYHS